MENNFQEIPSCRLHTNVSIDTQTSIISEMVSSSSTPLQKYDVFLSFRGEDTRNNLVSNLHAALKQRGIKTFFDEENLEKGQLITPELLKSIEESQFAIIVFSKNYASSTWCLDELVKIMECRTKYSLTVIPIFYHVDPSDIRKQKNSFAESFVIHEDALKDHKEKVQIWKEKLIEAAKISGYDFRNRPEAPLINEIVEDIFGKLPLKVSTSGLFGLEHRLKELCSLLAKEPNGVCFVGIWGMGGIGKTTTARAIFNELIDEFEGGCFLQDVSKNGLKDLQKDLLSKVLGSPVNIYSEFEGSDTISNRLRSKKLLLVLDDINNTNQLETLAGNKEWFGPGSRIIVTTRDKQLLNDVNEIYKIETLLDDEALQLFCWHAFKISHPPENFVQHSNHIVRYAGGLPLALKMLGSHLRNQQEDAWICTIEKLKDDPDKNIIATLKISFDDLSVIQQNIFLDIACFFRGHFMGNKDGHDFKDNKVNQKLDSFGFYPVVRIRKLIDKSLIHIESNNKVEMHDLIQEMGHDIVRQKADRNPERYSRLWDHNDINYVLTNGSGTGEIEGLILRDFSVDTIELGERAFINMNMLRLLEFYKSGLVVAPSYLPNSLRWLSWSGYPGKSLPGNFQPRNLVNLNLFMSSTLESIPDITRMPNLKFLDLSQCRQLLEVLPSVNAVHNKLIDINLKGCTKLKKFPRRINMGSLETLNLNDCSELQNLPEFHNNMICLRTLYLSSMKLKEYPWSVERLISLQEINFEGCTLLENLDDEVVNCFETQQSSLNREREADKIDEGCNASRMLTILLSLPSLKVVYRHECKVSEIILPESIGCLTSLQELYLNDNTIVSLPESINCFSSLQVLHLSKSKIKELPELPSSIAKLGLDGCKELTLILHPVTLLHKYENLCILLLVGCTQLANEFLLDWISLTNVLSRRREVLQLLLPPIESFHGLFQKIGSNATVTLSPSWYNDKFLGFVIFAISGQSDYTVVAINDHDLVTIIPKGDFTCGEHNAIFYIPIDKITSGRDWNEQTDCCLLKVTMRKGDVESWGIGLVYDGDNALKDTSDLIIDNHGVKDSSNPFGSTMKVCLTTRNQIQ